MTPVSNSLLAPYHSQDENEPTAEASQSRANCLDHSNTSGALTYLSQSGDLTFKVLTNLYQMRFRPDESFLEILTLPGLPRIHFQVQDHPSTKHLFGSFLYSALQHDKSLDYVPDYEIDKLSLPYLHARPEHLVQPVQPPMSAIFQQIRECTRDGANAEMRQNYHPKLRLIERHLKSDNKEFQKSIHHLFTKYCPTDPKNVDECNLLVHNMYLLAIYEEAASNPKVSREQLCQLGIGHIKRSLIENMCLSILHNGRSTPFPTLDRPNTGRKHITRGELIRSVHKAELHLKERFKIPFDAPAFVSKEDALITQAQIDRIGNEIENLFIWSNGTSLFKYFGNWAPWAHFYQTRLQHKCRPSSMDMVLVNEAKLCLINHRSQYFATGKQTVDDIFIECKY